MELSIGGTVEYDKSGKRLLKLSEASIVDGGFIDYSEKNGILLPEYNKPSTSLNSSFINLNIDYELLGGYSYTPVQKRYQLIDTQDCSVLLESHDLNTLTTKLVSYTNSKTDIPNTNIEKPNSLEERDW